MKIKPVHKLILFFASVIGVVSLAFFATVPVLAQGTNPPQGNGEALSSIYQKEQDFLNKQGEHLSKANDAVAKVQDLISKAQARGIDVSALQSALSTYQSQLATAQSSHQNAANILSAHNGFDGSGNVTDAAAARQTVQDAGQALKEAGNQLRQAVEDLHKNVKAWREASKDKLEDTALSKALAREQDWLRVQTQRLSNQNQIADKAQNLIEKGKAAGRDVSALQAALDNYNSQVASAQSSHQTAAGLLSAHNGFDGSGNVTDTATARQTLQDARQSLLDAHNMIHQALVDLQKAISTWREANQLPVSPTAQP
jgi:hypothetical protein